MTVTERRSYDVDNQTIAETLSTGSAIYTIPRFQRKYAWTKKEIDELLFDLLEDIDWSDEELNGVSSYFLGSIVIALENGIEMVLDGQQRLTSISLLLAIIKKKLNEENSEKASIVDQYLMKVSLKLREDNQIKLCLQPEDADVYKALIRDPSKWKSKELSDSLLSKAAQAIFSGIEHYLLKAGSVGLTKEVALLSMLDRILDLLRKSRGKSEFEVVNTSDKVEAETEAFAAAPVALCKDTEHFEPADDALDMQTKTGKRAVSMFFLVRQRMMLAGFDR